MVEGLNSIHPFPVAFPIDQWSATRGFHQPLAFDRVDLALALRRQQVQNLEGRRGVVAARQRLATAERLVAAYRALMTQPQPLSREAWQQRQAARRERAAARLKDALGRKAVALAAGAGLDYDEHGYDRGDHRTTKGLDFVTPKFAKSAPYFDMGGEGLGLIEVERKRVYARRCMWSPSRAYSRFLVGKNEAGTYFAHAVPNSIESVREALTWMWQGKEMTILARQGDVALCAGKARKLPALPEGHRVDIERGLIVHDTHPALPLPGAGQYLLVARRATPCATQETRG